MNKNEQKMIKLLNTLDDEQFNRLYENIYKKNKVHVKVLKHYWKIKKKTNKGEKN